MWCIREGTVVSKVDGEFLVLDVFPDSGKPPESKSRQDQPPTFVEVIPEDSKIPADLLAPADIAERRAIRESVGRTRRSPGHN